MPDYYQQIQSALAAAEYHEDTAFKLVKAADVNTATHHVRAFFWELFSVWDYMLQQANRSTLKLSTDKVRADGFLHRLEKQMSKYKHLDRLRAIEADSHLVLIRALRNEAHRFLTHPKTALLRWDGEIANITIARE